MSDQDEAAAAALLGSVYAALPPSVQAAFEVDWASLQRRQDVGRMTAVLLSGGVSHRTLVQVLSERMLSAQQPARVLYRRLTQLLDRYGLDATTPPAGVDDARGLHPLLRDLAAVMALPPAQR